MKILSCDWPLTRAKYKQVKVTFKFLDPLHSQTFSQEDVRPGSIDPMTAVVQLVKAFCVLQSFLFHDTFKIKWNTFSYIFCLVISSDSINEKVLMISVHH